MTDLMTPQIRLVAAEPADEQRQHEEHETLRAYARLFATSDGQRVLADIEQRSHVGRTTVTATRGRVDPYRTLYCEGRRAAALDIRARMLRGALVDRREPQTKAVSSTAEEM